MTRVRLVALLTCHNRCNKSIACLRQLYSQILPPAISVDTIIVDDGSTDGTSETIGREFPLTTIIAEDGSRFWNGGMRVAFGEALKRGYDYYLWLNDDTMLHPSAVTDLLETHHILMERGRESIIVGSTRDVATGALTYGGMNRLSRWHPFRCELVEPQAYPVACDLMNGNCVLIPQTVAEVIGNLDSLFTHSIGDFDYSWRARRAGFDIHVAPGYVGTCTRNEAAGRWIDNSLPLKTKFKLALGPKGLPFREWMEYSRRYAGLLWPLFGLLPYINIVSTHLISRIVSLFKSGTQIPIAKP